jgi:hypothetical protein
LRSGFIRADVVRRRRCARRRIANGLGFQRAGVLLNFSARSEYNCRSHLGQAARDA